MGRHHSCDVQAICDDVDVIILETSLITIQEGEFCRNGVGFFAIRTRATPWRLRTHGMLPLRYLAGITAELPLVAPSPYETRHCLAMP